MEKLNWLVCASKVNITRERKIKVGGTVYQLNIKSVCSSGKKNLFKTSPVVKTTLINLEQPCVYVYIRVCVCVCVFVYV